MSNASRNNDHIASAHRLLDALGVVFVAEAEPSFAVGYAQNFM